MSLNRSLARIPAIIAAASVALWRAVHALAREIGHAITSRARAIWATYARFEASCLNTLAEVILGVMALRWFVIMVAAPSLLFIWLKWWLPLIGFWAFLAVAIVRYFSIDATEIDREAQSVSNNAQHLVRFLRVGFRLAAALLMLYLSRNTILEGIQRAGDWLERTVTDRSVVSGVARPGTPGAFVPEGWETGAVPLAGGGAMRAPILSTRELFDEQGETHGYAVQYQPIEYKKYVADHLRARRRVPVYNSPDSGSSATPDLWIDRGVMVEVLEAFTRVDVATMLVVSRDITFPLPFSVSEAAPSGKPFTLRKGARGIVLHPTHGECPTFVFADLGVRSLCWPRNGEDGFTVSGGSVRTSFLLRTRDSVRWTRFVTEQGPPNTWLADDWEHCLEYTHQGKTSYSCG